jgi:hypothetical protein
LISGSCFGQLGKTAAPRNTEKREKDYKADDKPTEKDKVNITMLTLSHPNDLSLQKATKHPLECRIMVAISYTNTI